MRMPCLAFIFVLVSITGKAAAFPGAPLHEYLLAYGTPTNQKEPPGENHLERKIQYYWEGVEADPLSVGKKVKGNLFVLFEKRETALWSLQEIFLAGASDADSEEILRKIQEKWQTISKTTRQNPDRSYDLYQMISRDGRFSGEISYSSLESILSSRIRRSGSNPIPLFNLWIYLKPVR